MMCSKRLVLLVILGTLLLPSCSQERKPEIDTESVGKPAPDLYQTIEAPTPTPEPADSQDYTPNQQCLEAGFYGIHHRYQFDLYTSPSGIYEIFPCISSADLAQGTSLKIINTENNSYWTVSEKQLFGMNFPEDGVWIKPVHWDENNGLVYLTAQSGCPDSFECYIYQEGDAVVKVDIEDEIITEILPVNDSVFSFSFSPDGRYLVYADQNQTDLVHIMDVTLGDASVIKLDGQFVRMGAFSWTLSGEEIVFLGLSHQPGDFSTTVFLLDVESGELDILLSRERKILFPKFIWDNVEPDWKDGDTLILDSVDYGRWAINIRTKAFYPVK